MFTFMRLPSLFIVGAVMCAQATAGGFLSLKVGDNGSFDIWSDITYDLASGVVSFGIQGPLFCFDFSQTDTPLYLDVINNSGQQVLDQVSLQSPLSYDLATGDIKVPLAAGTRCFADLGDGTGFRLLDGDVLPDGLLFRDLFEIRRDISIAYVSEQDTILPGEIFRYQIIIENTGNVDLEVAGFQELYADNPEEFPAWFVQPFFTCSAEPQGAADCGTVPNWDELESFRVQNLKLNRGSKVIFNVERRLHPESEGGASVKFMAGVVPGFGREWDSSNNSVVFERQVAN